MLGDTIDVSNNSTAKQITGLGSAVIDLGMTPDVASTALSAVLNKSQVGGKPFKKWFDQMGEITLG
ncbi:hypothetical protein [Helicobacter salomonis]|uniref:hypothetical protein n=1 Tax=Helicobacter salomonis TaxID=56878 RepID=UPI000CF1504E|nr:hypothetical protein [Helicobacter salomonis]